MRPARRFFAACAVAAGGLTLTAAPAAAHGADHAPEPVAARAAVVAPLADATDLEAGQIPAPSLTYVASPARGSLLAALRRAPVAGATAGTTATVTAGAGGFLAPPNTDFVLDFAPSVDPASRAAVTAAAGVWSEVLSVRVPVHVKVDLPAMAPGVLGAAGPTSAFYGRTEFPRSDVLYPVALANQLAGTDLDPDAPDVHLSLSASVDWDKRTDGSSDPWTYSMTGVAVHELGHGLGHTSWVRDGGAGLIMNYDIEGRSMALAYDALTATAGGTPLTSLSGTDLQVALRSPLFWAGPRGAADLGRRPELFAPAVFEMGSSVGHLDEGLFGAGTMTPVINRGELHRSIPSITVAMLEDLGWTTTASPTPAEVQAAESYVRALAADFLDRPATAGEIRVWGDRLLRGTHAATVTAAFAGSDEWLGNLVDDLYQRTLGRGPDAAGRAYWISVARTGKPAAEIAALFYASDEFHARSGGTDAGWIDALYREILHRSADAGGRAYWVGEARRIGRIAVAQGFTYSLESRLDRVQRLYQDLLGRGADASGLAYWSVALLDGHDVRLAATLAASDEYRTRANRRFG